MKMLDLINVTGEDYTRCKCNICIGSNGTAAAVCKLEMDHVRFKSLLDSPMMFDPWSTRQCWKLAKSGMFWPRNASGVHRVECVFCRKIFRFISFDIDDPKHVMCVRGRAAAAEAVADDYDPVTMFTEKMLTAKELAEVFG